MLTLEKNKIKAVKTLQGIVSDISSGQIIDDDGDDYLILWLKVWLSTNESFLEKEPFNIIKQKINGILESNIVTPEDREDLYQTIAKIIDEI
jgi:hypothetical protein